MPCVADWLNNPFSIVQGIFGERGRAGLGCPEGERAPGGWGGREEGGGRGAGLPGGGGRAAGGRLLLPA